MDNTRRSALPEKAAENILTQQWVGEVARFRGRETRLVFTQEPDVVENINCVSTGKKSGLALIAVENIEERVDVKGDEQPKMGR